MITRKFETPFYSPVLLYEESKSETEYEKKLVQLYIDFLNAMAEKSEQMKNLRNEYYHETFLAEQIQPLLEKVEERYESVSKQVEKIKSTQIIDIPDFFLMRDWFYETNKIYLDLHKQYVDELRETINANEELFNKIYAWFEDEEDTAKYEQFHRFADELYHHYDNYSLDIIRFDHDVDEMKSEWQKIVKEWDTFFKFREETVKNTTSFCNRIATVNTLAQNLQRDIDEMQEAWLATNN